MRLFAVRLSGTDKVLTLPPPALGRNLMRCSEAAFWTTREDAEAYQRRYADTEVVEFDLQEVTR